MTLPPLFVDFVFVFVLFLFLFLLYHAEWGRGIHLFQAVDIGVMASSVATAIVLRAVIPQVETKMAPTMMTLTITNEMCHGAPSTPLSDPRPREGEGKGDEDEGGGHCHGRWW